MKKAKIPIRTMFAGVMLAVIVPFVLFGETFDARTASLIELAQVHWLQAGLLLTLLLALGVVTTRADSPHQDTCTEDSLRRVPSQNALK